MKLMRITGQSQKDLRQFYDLSQWKSEGWHKPISAMLELVIYLEDAVDFAPQWVFTSHESLSFTTKDDYSQSSINVAPLREWHEGPAKAKYELRYRIEPPWSHTVGYATNVEQAWQMVAEVLSRSTA